MNDVGVAEVPADKFRPGPRTSLAYVGLDDRFCLYNEYGPYRTLLVPGPPPRADDRRLAELWRPGQSGIRPISVDEHVQGYGVFTFPYGPVAMGTGETGAFDLTTYGERLLEAVPSVGFKHRRVLDRLVGRTIDEAALWVERRAGPYALAHVSAFLAAGESAEGRAVPMRELTTRALGQELQRLHAHVRVIARIAETASQNVGAAQMQALGEEMLRTIGTVFGHRWGFGGLLPDGPVRQLGPPARRSLADRLVGWRRRFEALWASFLESRTFIDRIQGTATISPEEAIRFGAVGPALRASGVAWDDRLRAPSFPYRELFVSLAREERGDALARVLVRQEEIRGSLLLLEQLLDRWDREAAGATAPGIALGPGHGLARVEAPLGDLVYEVRTNAGRVAAVGVRTPSDTLWPLLALGLRGGVFTDFGFTVESFAASFAETDG